MSNEAVLHAHSETGVHDAHGDHHHEHHHHETFITKYVFSQDHKMIAKQFLITGIVWAIIGGLFSVLFRLQEEEKEVEMHIQLLQKQLIYLIEDLKK